MNRKKIGVFRTKVNTKIVVVFKTKMIMGDTVHVKKQLTRMMWGGQGAPWGRMGAFPLSINPRTYLVAIVTLGFFAVHVLYF